MGFTTELRVVHGSGQGRGIWKKGDSHDGVRVVIHGGVWWRLVYGEARATEGGTPFFTKNLPSQ